MGPNPREELWLGKELYWEAWPRASADIKLDMEESDMREEVLWSKCWGGMDEGRWEEESSKGLEVGERGRMMRGREESRVVVDEAGCEMVLG